LIVTEIPKKDNFLQREIPTWSKKNFDSNGKIVTIKIFYFTKKKTMRPILDIIIITCMTLFTVFWSYDIYYNSRDRFHFAFGSLLGIILMLGTIMAYLTPDIAGELFRADINRQKRKEALNRLIDKELDKTN
jgi:hypothetical protein